MRRLMLISAVLLCVCIPVIGSFTQDVLADTLSLPLSLPATINGTTYQHGVVVIFTTGNHTKQWWYYNQTSGQQLYGCTLPLNPTVYTPYNRFDIWYTQARWCSENDYSPGRCSNSSNWYTSNNSNHGFIPYTTINGTNGQAYSDLDWVNTNSGLCYQGTLYRSVNWNSLFPQQLSVVLNPAAGGGVSDYPAGENIYCGIDQYEICEATFDLNTEVTLDAYPNTDYAFAHWDDGTTNLYDNPLTLIMDSAKTLTAKFFRTFRNAVGDFRQSSGDGDECVIYVRNETDILSAACHGEAADCFSQAQSAGYSTGNAPRIGSVIVFDRGSGDLSIGHVGIVTGINGTNVTMQDSNWVAYHTIGNHTVDVSGYSIAGYIYYTP